MSKWLGGISEESSEPVLLMSITLYIDPESAALTHSRVDSATSASYLTLFFSDIARFCLDRPVVFLPTLSSIMNIPVAQRSWTRAFVVVNSS